MSDATNYDPTEQLDDPAIGRQTAVNDAVAGEPVIDTNHYAGPTGSEPLEAEPEQGPNDLEDEFEIDLGDTVE